MRNAWVCTFVLVFLTATAHASVSHNRRVCQSHEPDSDPFYYVEILELNSHSPTPMLYVNISTSSTTRTKEILFENLSAEGKYSLSAVELKFKDRPAGAGIQSQKAPGRFALGGGYVNFSLNGQDSVELYCNPKLPDPPTPPLPFNRFSNAKP